MKKLYSVVILSVFLSGLLLGCNEKKVISDETISVENNFKVEESANIEIVVDSEEAIEEANTDALGEDTGDEEDTSGEADIKIADEESADESLVDIEAEREDEESEETDLEADPKDNGDDALESGEENDSIKEPQQESLATTAVTPGSVENVAFNEGWTYANFSAIHTGSAVMYRAADNRKGIVVGVNAGHGTKGGGSVKTYCHPDMTPKVTGGSTSAGSLQAAAVSGGMSFYDGTAEATVTLREAQLVRDKLLAAGYDVLMLRDGSDVQLDNVARTVICNNMANCHIAIHWDGDGLSTDKGCFYISTPDGIKGMEPVASTWTKSEALGKSLIAGLTSQGCKIYKGGSMAIDLTQTSYSTVPSVDVELGNAASAHDDASLSILADGIVAGVKSYFP